MHAEASTFRSILQLESTTLQCDIPFLLCVVLAQNCCRQHIYFHVFKLVALLPANFLIFRELLGDLASLLLCAFMLGPDAAAAEVRRTHMRPSTLRQLQSHVPLYPERLGTVEAVSGVLGS